MARLVEAEGDGERALAAAREAFAADPSLPVTLWGLRRLLSRAGQWQELADAYQTAADAVAARRPARRAARARARICSSSGGGCWRIAWGATTTRVASYDAALRGRSRSRGRAARPAAGGRAPARAGGDRRRARWAWRGGRKARAGPRWRSRRRASGGSPRRVPDGAARALGVLTAELERGDAALPLATVLGELEALTAADAPPDVAVRALAEIAGRVAPLDRELAVALWRERARVQIADGWTRRPTPLASLEEAARLDPAHPVVAMDRLQLVEALAGGAAADALAPS